MQQVWHARRRILRTWFAAVASCTCCWKPIAWPVRVAALLDVRMMSGRTDAMARRISSCSTTFSTSKNCEVERHRLHSARCSSVNVLNVTWRLAEGHGGSAPPMGPRDCRMTIIEPPEIRQTQPATSAAVGYQLSHHSLHGEDFRGSQALVCRTVRLHFSNSLLHFRCS